MHHRWLTRVSEHGFKGMNDHIERGIDEEALERRSLCTSTQNTHANHQPLTYMALPSQTPSLWSYRPKMKL
jgi:hypothetical protein